MNRNKKLIKATCTSLNHEGKGIIEFNKKKIVIDYLLPKEEAEIMIEESRKMTTGTLGKIIKKSSMRVKAKCPYFSVCGGCQTMHMNYEDQSKFKLKTVEKLMSEFGKVNSIMAMESPYHYRNKTTYSFSQNAKKITAGFYKAYSHDVINVEKCLIEDERFKPIIDTVKELVKKHKIRVYDEDKKYGFIRHVQLRSSYKNDEIMVTIVAADNRFPGKSKFIKDLTARHKNIKTIILNINKSKSSVVLGKSEIVLFGNGFITDEIMGTKFRISSQSFYQINPTQTERLYEKAIEMANIKKNEIVLDTYSGIGTITLLAAGKAKQSYGVEINKTAVKNAFKNAQINNIKNVHFVESDASHAMVEMSKEDFHIDVLFMDPPRSGSDEKFLNAVKKLKPKKIVYISCNPETQRRDLNHLKGMYKVEEIHAVDMFPHTGHVETVVKLNLK